MIAPLVPETLRLPVDADLAEASLEDAIELLNDDMPSAGCLLICGQKQWDTLERMGKTPERKWSFPAVALVPEEILDHPDSWALIGRNKQVVQRGQ
jgi:hypothetical protein